MNYTEIVKRMSFLLYGPDSGRTIVYKDNETINIQIDLHQLGLIKTEKVLSGIMLLLPIKFTLVLIHGYVHGTVLKEYIWNNLDNARIDKKMSPMNNPGITYLSILEKQ